MQYKDIAIEVTVTNIFEELDVRVACHVKERAAEAVLPSMAFERGLVPPAGAFAVDEDVIAPLRRARSMATKLLGATGPELGPSALLNALGK